jgi:alanine dehydrogenase
VHDIFVVGLERAEIGVDVDVAVSGLDQAGPKLLAVGRLAPQMGAHYLERHNGGRGVLMGGAPGVQPAKVVVLGAGKSLTFDCRLAKFGEVKKPGSKPRTGNFSAST